jgi:hypothetical protein
MLGRRRESSRRLMHPRTRRFLASCDSLCRFAATPNSSNGPSTSVARDNMSTMATGRRAGHQGGKYLNRKTFAYDRLGSYKITPLALDNSVEMLQGMNIQVTVTASEKDTADVRY